ncbi:MAG: alpha-1,4-glucan--maltose-1-phosphate maltosyltransferase, partial [Gemmatimonadales bacterium]
RIRRDNPALQRDWGLRFHRTDNPAIICYSKATDDLESVVLVAVNLDPERRQAGWVDLDLEELGLAGDQPFQIHDELSDVRYLWQGSSNYVELDPEGLPAHVFRIRRRVLTEQDFDYYV